MEDATQQAAGGKTILFMEDDAFITDVVGDKLRQAGFVVHTAPDGKAGLEALGQVTPDLILLDLVMPNVNGYEVLAELKKSEQWRQIPVVVFSNLGEQEEIERASALGAHSHIIKSTLTPDEVATKVKTALGIPNAVS